MEGILNSLKQEETPLNTLFFCHENIILVNRAIRQQIKIDTGVAIDYQNTSDILAIMRTVFINNQSKPYSDVESQVKQMNVITINKCVSQIKTNLSQFYGYARELGKPVIPPAIPTNTSLYGNKMGYNDKIGIN